MLLPGSGEHLNTWRVGTAKQCLTRQASFPSMTRYSADTMNMEEISSKRHKNYNDVTRGLVSYHNVKWHLVLCNLNLVGLYLECREGRTKGFYPLASHLQCYNYVSKEKHQR